MPTSTSVFHRIVRAACAATVRPLLERASPTGVQLVLLRTLFTAVTAVTAAGHESADVTVIDDRDAKGRRVAGEWVRAAGCTRRDEVILYCHGGGYIATAPAHYRGITARLSALTGLAVFAVDYRLAPEHPYPSALSDASAAYTWLRDQGADVVLVGDSAGAHLAVALSIDIAMRGARAPQAMVLFSPLLDISCRDAATLDAQSPDPMMSPRFASACAAALGVDADSTDPRVAPLSAGDKLLSRLPPTLSIAGGTECFRHDAQRLRQRLTAAGVAAQHIEFPGHIHDFVLFTRTTAAQAALRRAADFLATTRQRNAFLPVAN